MANTGAGVYAPSIVIGQETGAGTYTERVRVDQNGNVGIGTTSPNATLDVKGEFRYEGSSSGYVGFQAPATVTTSVTFTLPNGDGAAGQSLNTNGSGSLSWRTPPIIIGGNGSWAVPPSTTAYMNPNFTNPSVTEALVQMIMPIGGTVRALYTLTNTAQPASGSLVAMLRKNGADCNLTVTYAANASAGAQHDTSHTCTFAAGDLLEIQYANGATVNSATLISHSILVTP